MPSPFPTSLDSFTDPTATSKLNSPSHSAQHTIVNDAVEKIEAKIGINGSADTNSIDYKLTTVIADLNTVETNIGPRETALVDAASVAINTTAHGIRVLTATDLTGDTREISFTGGVAGKTVILKFIQGTAAAAGQSLTYAGVTWVGGTAPTLVTTANKINLIGFLMTGATTCLGMPMGDF